jgi:hypothetical protein
VVELVIENVEKRRAPNFRDVPNDEAERQAWLKFIGVKCRHHVLKWQKVKEDVDPRDELEHHKNSKNNHLILLRVQCKHRQELCEEMEKSEIDVEDDRIIFISTNIDDYHKAAVQ